jgi:hypothetical protein
MSLTEIQHARDGPCFLGGPPVPASGLLCRGISIGFRVRVSKQRKRDFPSSKYLQGATHFVFLPYCFCVGVHGFSSAFCILTTLSYSYITTNP